MHFRDTWVAQLVERPTLRFVSGRGLVVRGIGSRVGLCTDSTEPAWDSLSLSLSAPPLVLLLSLSLSQNK